GIEQPDEVSHRRADRASADDDDIGPHVSTVFRDSPSEIERRIGTNRSERADDERLDERGIAYNPPASGSVARRGFEPLTSSLKGKRPSPLGDRASPSILL